MKIFTFGDKAVVAFVLTAALFFYVLFTFIVFAGYAENAEVRVDGEIYAVYRLKDIKNSKTVKIETGFGTNVLEIMPDGVRMLDASCNDKNDVKMGKITRVNQMLICIPNRLTVQLTGDSEMNVDKVTY